MFIMCYQSQKKVSAKVNECQSIYFERALLIIIVYFRIKYFSKSDFIFTNKNKSYQKLIGAIKHLRN
jgi:hypothetical protein